MVFKFLVFESCTWCLYLFYMPAMISPPSSLPVPTTHFLPHTHIFSERGRPPMVDNKAWLIMLLHTKLFFLHQALAMQQIMGPKFQKPAHSPGKGPDPTAISPRNTLSYTTITCVEGSRAPCLSRLPR